MKYKKVIAVSLCVGIVFSSIGTIFANFEDNGSKGFKIPFITNTGKPDENDARGNPMPDSEIQKEAKTEEVDVAAGGEEVLYKGNRTSPNNEDPLKADKYHFTEKDIEEQLKEGYTITDIFKADEIGNSIDEDPKSLLKRKKEQNKDLETVKNDVLKERKSVAIQKLKEKYPEEYNLMVQEQLNKDDQLVLLSFVDKNTIKSIQQLLKDYKEKGRDIFKEHTENKKTKVSKELMEKYELTDEEVEGLSDELIVKLEAFAAVNNMSVKELVVGFKAQKEKAKGGDK